MQEICAVDAITKVVQSSGLQSVNIKEQNHITLKVCAEPATSSNTFPTEEESVK